MGGKPANVIPMQQPGAQVSRGRRTAKAIHGGAITYRAPVELAALPATPGIRN